MDSTIDVLVPEHGKPVVMRRHLDMGSPDSAIASACREAGVLRALEPTSVAPPGLVAVDPKGEHCGTPSVLAEFMDGSREVPGDLRTLAAELARTMAMIHDTSPPPVDGLPDATGLVRSALSEECPDLHGQSPSATMWSLVRDQPAPSDLGPQTLIHNDFAPHNTLFVGDRLSGVGTGPSQLRVTQRPRCPSVDSTSRWCSGWTPVIWYWKRMRHRSAHR